MNRPIKFRAWDKEGKRMGDVSGLQFPRPWGGDVFEPYAEVLFGTVEVELHRDDVELMQFTGLTDKNGKDVYEGDVVRIVPDEKKAFTNEPHHPSFMYGDVAKVEWDDVNAKFSLFDVHGEDTEIGYYAGWSGWNWLEVIGNIYENPELLSV